MTTSDRIDLVERYVHELAIALADLPGAERDDVIAGVREHIDASLAGLTDPSADDVQRVLDELGDPLVIAAGAAARPPAAAGRTPAAAGQAPAVAGQTSAARVPLLQRDWVPAATVLSLSLGALLFWLIVPIAFWLLGLVLLWLSPLWRVGEKVLGTFVLGLIPFLYGFLGVLAWSTSGGSTDCVSGSIPDEEIGASAPSALPEVVCTSTSTGPPLWLGPILLGLLLAAIVAVAVLLWRRGAARVPRGPAVEATQSTDEPAVRASR